jgi:hypothetical protein
VITSIRMSVSSTYLPGCLRRFPSLNNGELYIAEPLAQIPWAR